MHNIACVQHYHLEYFLSFFFFFFSPQLLGQNNPNKHPYLHFSRNCNSMHPLPCSSIPRIVSYPLLHSSFSPSRVQKKEFNPHYDATTTFLNPISIPRRLKIPPPNTTHRHPFSFFGESVHVTPPDSFSFPPQISLPVCYTFSKQQSINNTFHSYQFLKAAGTRQQQGRRCRHTQANNVQPAYSLGRKIG